MLGWLGRFTDWCFKRKKTVCGKRCNSETFPIGTRVCYVTPYNNVYDPEEHFTGEVSGWTKDGIKIAIKRFQYGELQEHKWYTVSKLGYIGAVHDMDLICDHPVRVRAGF